MATILIVDDEESIRLAFRELLEMEGHVIAEAENVEQAKNHLGHTRFDVVVSDIIMPGLKGTDLLKIVRQQETGAQVILVTGEPTIETASQAIREGAFDYLAKPVSARELRDTVDKAVKIKQLHDEKILLAEENKRYQNHLEQLVEQRTAELKKALFGIVTAMSVTVEKRDPYTAGHQLRVAQLAKAIAAKLHLPKEQIDGVYLAGVIHDVGKISIPAEILVKPSKLTKDEFSIIKTHPEVGYEILKNIEFPWPIATVVLQHHERLDGSGYPQGLKEPAILSEAKILAVADVVEAMATHRPYRPALGIGPALEEVSRNSGLRYDKEIVEICHGLFYLDQYQFSVL